MIRAKCRIFFFIPIIFALQKILVGGIGGDRSRNSSEFISLDQGSNPLKGPDLPFNISSHCMLQFNSEAIYIIGGR